MYVRLKHSEVMLVCNIYVLNWPMYKQLCCLDKVSQHHFYKLYQL